jgi:hypothetical protein
MGRGPEMIAVKELTAYEIAAAVAGRPGSPGLELRLLRLFQSEALDRVESESSRNVVPRAA